jgi:hypothetical protein
MANRPTLPEASPAKTQPEITPDMIEAGVTAYCQSPFEPSEDEMRVVVRQIFCAMRAAQKFRL